MKKYIFIAIAAFGVLACTNTSKEELVRQQRDSLLGVIESSETTVNEYITYFNEVERNLDSVTARQRVIMMNTGKKDLKVTQKERIALEIKAINKLMDSNNKKIKELRGKFNASNKKNVELEKTIDILNNQLTMKYVELINLNEELKGLNEEVAEFRIVVDTLMIRNSQLSQSIENKSGELRAAYYIVGTSVDLQQWNLVDKQGGFLGIGQTAKLSNNLDMNMFTKIDYLQTTTIPINSKGIKIITTHPTGSFSLNKNGRTVESITINDPELFWSASKYLVISL
ncbi:MAG: hypothetical protein KA163_07585 [Bacteroidia bacterium]|nr:hypothetical protein [Bacteroidia bacterium]